jgi:hypothetical protein
MILRLYLQTLRQGLCCRNAARGLVMTARHRNSGFSWRANDAEREPPETCSVSGKRMYATEREANETATHRMADKEKGPSQLRAYRCLYCMAWHLTSQEPSAKRKK